MIQRIRMKIAPPATLLLAVLLVGGCAVRPGAPTSALLPGHGPVRALLLQAQAEEQAGQPRSALALLERAVRLAPRDPYAWHHLARLRLQLGEPEKARELARRSNRLTRDEALRRANDALLQQIR